MVVADQQYVSRSAHRIHLRMREYRLVGTISLIEIAQVLASEVGIGSVDLPLDLFECVKLRGRVSPVEGRSACHWPNSEWFDRSLRAHRITHPA